MIGFVVGIARLSNNWLVAKLAAGYVELIRNVPLLLQLLFWYNAVLKSLPRLRDSCALPGGLFLNNRGLFLPGPKQARRFDAVRSRSPPALLRRSLLRLGRTGVGEERARGFRSDVAVLGACGRIAARRLRFARVFRCISTFRRPAASTSAAASNSCRNSWR